MQLDYPGEGYAAPASLSASASLPSAASASGWVAVPRGLAAVARRWIGPVAIALLLFEGLIRSAIYSPRPQVTDPILGPMPAPGSTWVNGREGFGRFRWSAQGVRGRDLPAAVGPKAPRVVVIGDSYTR